MVSFLTKKVLLNNWRVIALGAVGLLAFFKLKGWFVNDEESFQANRSLEAGAELSEVDANLIVDRLVESFSGGFMGFGTDEESIRSIFESLSPPDIVKVYNRFGKKSYDGSQVNNDNGEFFGLIPFSKPRTLIYILKAELSGGLLSMIKDKFVKAGLPF